jgi:hypothetical protein
MRRDARSAGGVSPSGGLAGRPGPHDSAVAGKLRVGRPANPHNSTLAGKCVITRFGCSLRLPLSNRKHLRFCV